MSLPTRERGLKYVWQIYFSGPVQSLPTRERGLKYSLLVRRPQTTRVAPYAGAWIEILMVYNYSCKEVSLPTRERGLKSTVFVIVSSPCLRRSLRGSVD